MAAPTNSTSTFNSKGIREDLSDILSRINPNETPFTRSIKKGKAKNTYTEWQTEELDAVGTTNAQIEGDDATIDTPNLTRRLGNVLQIFRKTGAVNSTADAVEMAGRAEEFTRQKLIKAQSMKRDIEYAYLKNQGSTKGDAGNARVMAGALAWANTTSLVGANTGVSGGYVDSTGLVTAAVNGSTRQLTEQHVKDALLSMGNAGATTGGDSLICLMGAALKARFGAFNGLSQNRHEVKRGDMGVVTSSVELYVSDFGTLTLVPHFYALTREVVIYDPEYFSTGDLRSVGSEDLAKTGDSRKFLITAETTLKVINEKALGVIHDVTA